MLFDLYIPSVGQTLFPCNSTHIAVIPNTFILDEQDGGTP